MQATAKLDSKQIDEMQLEITFKMRVKDWKELLRQQSQDKYPSLELIKRIDGVLDHLDEIVNYTLSSDI